MAKAKRRGRPTGSSGKAAPKKAKKIDQLIDAIFSVLPATTQEEILLKVAKRWKGDELELSDIAHALGHLRKNAVKYAWTVPYVSAGRPTKVDIGRYFIAEVNPDGRVKCSPRNQEHLRRGFERVMNTAATFVSNEAIAVDIVSKTLPLALQRDAHRTASRMIGFSRENLKMLADFSEKLEAA
jgi:hypothetical protein